MSLTALQLVQKACYQANLTAPSALVGATDASVLQYLHLFYETGEELRQMRCWPQLKKRYRFPLISQRQFYQLPQDFYSELPETAWDESLRWKNVGPVSDAYFNYRAYGYATIENRKAFRVFGPDGNPNSSRGQMQLSPIPGATYAGLYMSFEYITKSWLMPPNWAASTSYNGSTPNYVNVNGNIYKCATAGANNSGTTPPSVAFNGEGQDGGVFWTVLATPAWTNTTAYAPQDYVTNGGNLYVCTVGGTSAGSGGPTGTSSSAVTDGTVSWLYCAASSWTAETAFAAGTFIKISSTYYKNTTPGIYANGTAITGKVQPTWIVSTTTWKETDGSTSWTFYQPAYEALITDNDICLFDDDLMVLGLKWKFLQANRREYEDYKAQYDLRVDAAQTRWNDGMRFNVCGSNLGLVGYKPNLPEGGYGL